MQVSSVVQAELELPAPALASPSHAPLEGLRRPDRRYLAGCVAGLLIGAALALPGAYALLGASGGQAENRELLATLLNAGLGALADKKPARALELFRATERAFPRNSRVYNNICVALNDLGRYAEAAESCKLALALEPSFALARNNLRWAQAQLAKPSTSPAREPLAARHGPLWPPRMI